MGDLTTELADKIELHLKLDVPGAGYFLTEEDQRIIVDCLRASTPKSDEIERLQKLVDAQGQQDRDETLRGLAAFFSESEHMVWSNDEIADCLTGMIGGSSASAQEANKARRPHNSHEAWFTHDDSPGDHCYYFAPVNSMQPPYHEQRQVKAIIDVAPDGTLAGVELIDDMPPPPDSSINTTTQPVAQEAQEPAAWRYKCHDGTFVFMEKRLTDEQKARGYYRDEDDFECEEDECDEWGPFYWSEETALYTTMGLPVMCEECGKYPADLPSKICPGCEAYQDHQR